MRLLTFTNMPQEVISTIRAREANGKYANNGRTDLKLLLDDMDALLGKKDLINAS